MKSRTKPGIFTPLSVKTLREGTNACLCRACDRIFHNVKAFDEHRVGSFRDGSRRCATEQEMIDAGLYVERAAWRWPPNPAPVALRTAAGRL